ncbi:MAG: hypothetical protein AB7S26_32885 [Sandaracinaceae bacterium]
MRPILPFVLVALTACGGKELHFEASPSEVSSVAGETVRVELTLLDADGRGIGGEPIAFSLDGAPDGASVRPPTATSDSRGLSVAIVTLAGEGTFDLVATSERAVDGVVPITVGGRTDPYIDCTNDTECAPSERCLEVSSGGTSGRMCTRECTDEALCPTRTERGAACITAGARPVCVARCQDPLDCIVGNSCLSLTTREGTNMVCLPN